MYLYSMYSFICVVCIGSWIHVFCFEFMYICNISEYMYTCRAYECIYICTYKCVYTVICMNTCDCVYERMCICSMHACIYMFSISERIYTRKKSIYFHLQSHSLLRSIITKKYICFIAPVDCV